jgi:hypothetical protein
MGHEQPVCNVFTLELKGINVLLTAEQQKAYAALEQEMRSQQRNRRSDSTS